MSDIRGRAVPTGSAPEQPSSVFDIAESAAAQTPARLLAAFLAGAGVGVLGGMIGLGGAEFRLPLLIGVFGFAALAAVILNKALSLVVVLTALPARLIAVPFDQVAPHWTVVVNLLAGSLVGAWLGATWATRLRSATLYRVLAVLLAVIAAVLLATHFATIPSPELAGPAQIVVGVIAGVGIGVVAALMGVAGGELLIPTIVLLYGLDIRIAGSLSLAVSLPTMLVAFARYSRDASFVILRRQARFAAVMALGSVTGVLLGGLLLGVVSDLVLVPILAVLLILSAFKIWKHD
ncbi:MAG TPA: sulfite exporter TauE/SafE family protein [Egibacteraceae bacterium]|nr:sulfite exporter TauE/SafE family protein [Egibacteraceae bacterium]